MKIVRCALLMFWVCISCKEKETSPIYTIVGSYQATIYDSSSPKPVGYPISDHTMSVKVVSATDSTVNVEIVSTPPKGALPTNVFLPPSGTFRNVLSVKEGTPTNSTFYVNLNPVFGQPNILSNAIVFYGGTDKADYYYTPAETPTITRTIRLERKD